MKRLRPHVSLEALSFKVTPACWSVWASLQQDPGEKRA